MEHNQPGREQSEETNQSPWGFHVRTVWDWLQLLIVPLTLVGIGLVWLVFDLRQQEIEGQRAERERQLEEQRAQDAVLQAYLDQMGVLLIEKDLRGSERLSEVRTLARARTLTVLERLDPSRKTEVMRFLIEAGLIQVHGQDATGAPIISLDRADLSGADLSSTEPNPDNMPVGVSIPVYPGDLSGAELNYADLSGADLSGAFLYQTDLVGANLSCADLSQTHFGKANLTAANLRHATGILEKSERYLEDPAFSLAGATMPNGQNYEDWVKSNDTQEYEDWLKSYDREKHCPDAM